MEIISTLFGESFLELMMAPLDMVLESLPSIKYTFAGLIIPRANSLALGGEFVSGRPDHHDPAGDGDLAAIGRLGDTRPIAASAAPCAIAKNRTP